MPVTMHRHTIAVFLFVLIAGYVSCNLIKSSTDIGTKDVAISREDLENNDPTVPQGMNNMNVDVMPLQQAVDTPKPAKKCAKIGEFCTFHGECCTHACLGYMKRCVTSSNLYPDYVEEHP